MWQKVLIKDFTNNLDSKRKPLNNLERNKRKSNPIYPYFGANGVVDYIDNYIFDEKIICIAEDGGSWGKNQNSAYIVNEKCWVNNHAHVLSPKAGLSLEYLRYFLNHIDLNEYITGSTRGKLTKGDLEKIQIPLPLIEEQKRIAEVLDKADELRRLDRQLLEKYDSFLQSVFLDLFGDPVTNPKGWKVKEMKDIVKPDKIITYGIVQAGPHIDNGIPYIKTGDIKNNQINTKSLSRTSLEIAESYKRSEVETGDIIMSIRATVGTVAILPQELDGANLTQGTARISPGKLVNNKYLFYYLQTNSVQNWIEQQVKGATFREITLTRLRQLPVLIPTFSLQNKFASIVEKTEAQKALIRQNLQNSESLFQSFLQSAFNGSLQFRDTGKALASATINVSRNLASIEN